VNFYRTPVAVAVGAAGEFDGAEEKLIESEIGRDFPTFPNTSQIPPGGWGVDGRRRRRMAVGEWLVGHGRGFSFRAALGLAHQMKY
jgi:hypothetical protein